MKRWMIGLMAVLVALPLASCGQKRSRYEATFLSLFDTVTTIVGYNNSKDDFTKQAQYIHDQLEVYHKLYDIYHSYNGINNLKTINDNAGVSPVQVDQKIIDLLLEAKSMYAQTGGRVNVAMGSVLSIWHDYRSEGIDDSEHAELPPMYMLREAAKHTDIEKLVIDESAMTVYLSDAKMSLDVGALAKGYATERVCQSARENEIKSLLVSVGGNVCAIGEMDGFNGPWRVGVQNTESGTLAKNLFTVGLHDQSLVSSGNYQRYYLVKGVPYHHIIDPDTLMPANYFTAVNVVAKDSGVADALSTALYNLPLEQGKALAASFPDTEAMWILHDKSYQFSGGFEKLILKK